MSGLSWAPVDSTDARERREHDQADAIDLAQRSAAIAAAHAERCIDGLLGEDETGRPIACPVCRPHLVDVSCSTCGQRASACRRIGRARNDFCCDRCSHPSRGDA